MSKQIFDGIGKVHEFFQARTWLTAPVNWIFARWAPNETEENISWEKQAEHAMLEETPIRAKQLLYWVTGIVVVMLVWSAVTEIDEVTKGEGRVVPSKQVQQIQSLDGGIVTEILVKEGQAVKIGDSLIKIDETRAKSSLRENQTQYISLLAKQSRLQALAKGRPFDPPPEVQKQDPVVYAQEYSLYNSSNEALASQVGIAREQVSQRERELSEVQAKVEQAERGLALTSQELSVTKPLQSSGAVSEVDLLRLERDVARLRGERDQARAQIGRVHSAIAEARRKISEIEQSFRSKIEAELSETTAKLNSIDASSEALTDKVKQSTLKSPVNGTVSRLFANTVGGVIQPGKEVMELVPSDDALVLEAKVQPKDIAFITLNQNASVKLTAYDYTIYGTLDAVVIGVGADSIVDDKGNAYYIVRVRTIKSSLGKNLPIIPGMVAQVDIMTGKKSILAYLLKPVLKARAYAFTER